MPAKASEDPHTQKWRLYCLLPHINALAACPACNQYTSGSGLKVDRA